MGVPRYGKCLLVRDDMPWPAEQGSMEDPKEYRRAFDESDKAVCESKDGMGVGLPRHMCLGCDLQQITL